jgi:hypothetical protein
MSAMHFPPSGICLKIPIVGACSKVGKNIYLSQRRLV